MRIFCGMATAGNNIFCIMGSWDAKTGKNSSDITYFLLRIGFGHSLPSLKPFSPPWTVCTKVLNCLDVGGESSALIAAGGSDPILRIWDPCKPGSFNSRLTLLGFRLASGMTTLGFV
ncbi:hypothetical protein CMV_008218 [Castanea mollissima]|nr:hypothetical protein CMV_008218 [Castanea mollissima]